MATTEQGSRVRDLPNRSPMCKHRLRDSRISATLGTIAPLLLITAVVVVVLIATYVSRREEMVKVAMPALVTAITEHLHILQQRW